MNTKIRTALLVGGCFVAGLVAVPAVATAKTVASDVVVTNTADNPVPVAVQGTAQITGTVTVANPTPPVVLPSPPIPVQVAFEQQPITRTNPFASGILYRVPEGKVLTVEYFQAHWLFSGIGLRQADIRAGCINDPDVPGIDHAQIFFPDQDAGLGYHVVGGPVKLLVAGGNCLSYEVGADYADFPDDQSNLTLFMYGSFTGYLTDAP